MATQQKTQTDAERREARKREQKRLDSIQDSKDLFLKKTRGLNHTHPTYKEEKKKHDQRLGAIQKLYG